MIALLRAIPLWAYILAGALALLGVQQVRISHHKAETARAETATTKAKGELETFRREAAESVAAAQAEARQQEQRHAADLSRIAYQYQEDRKNEGDAAYARAIADVRSGKLRNVWQACPAAASVPGPATGPSGSDGPADDRSEAIARVLRIGAEADAQLRACQAVIVSDREVRKTK